MQMKREWIAEEGKMAAISIAQPFGTAIVLGRKTIELRTWGTRYRGLIAIHVGKSWYGGVKDIRRASASEFGSISRAAQRMSLPTRIEDYPLGAIIGVAKLVRCARFTAESWERLRDQHRSDGVWHPDIIGWQFEDVQALPEPIYGVRGQLGLFAVDEIHIEGSQVVVISRKGEPEERREG